MATTDGKFCLQVRYSRHVQPQRHYYKGRCVLNCPHNWNRTETKL